MDPNTANRSLLTIPAGFRSASEIVIPWLLIASASATAAMIPTTFYANPGTSWRLCAYGGLSSLAAGVCVALSRTYASWATDDAAVWPTS